MKGVSHATIGAGIGIVINFATDGDIANGVILVGAGIFASLVPDLDTGGKLTNKITFSEKYLKKIMSFVSILILLYALFQLESQPKTVGLVVGIILLLVSLILTKKIMLLMTGVILIISGYYMSIFWLLLFGLYVIIAALSPHRSYTHSVLGLVFFVYIAHLFSGDLNKEGLFTTLVLGYGSHLVADMKVVPTNKRGIPLFKPLLKKEF